MSTIFGRRLILFLFLFHDLVNRFFFVCNGIETVKEN